MIVSLAGLSSPVPFSTVSRRGVVPSELSWAQLEAGRKQRSFRFSLKAFTQTLNKKM